MKHITQHGAMHMVPLTSHKNHYDKDCSICTYYLSGFCVKDNQPCMDSNYCKDYTTDYIDLMPYKHNSIAIYTIEMVTPEDNQELTIYMTKQKIYNGEKQLNFESKLAQELLKQPKKNESFSINDATYTIKNFEIKSTK